MTSWTNRGKAAGWTEELTSESLVSKINAAENKADSAINKANTNTTAINELKTAVGKKADDSRVDVIANSVNSNTDDIIDIKKKLPEKADLVNGKLDPNQLPDIDTTLYELAPNNTLPSTLADINKNHIYLVKAATAGTNNVYAEYIYTGTSATYDATNWEKLGEVSAKVDLSGYATTTYVQNTVNTAKHDVKPDTVNFTKHTGTTDLDIDIRNSDGVKLTKPVSIPLVNIDENTNGLMSPSMLTKLNGIANGANNYTHPAHTAHTSGLYKITVDGLGHVSATAKVEAEDLKAAGALTSAPAFSLSNNGGDDYINVEASYNGEKYVTSLPPAGKTNAGVMSKTLYNKLADIADGATKNEIDTTLTSTGTNAVQGKVIYDAINTHKITGSNLTEIGDSTQYTVIALNDGDGTTIGPLTDVLYVNYSSSSHSTLGIDSAAVWDEVTLKAISDTELTKILV